MNAPDRFVLCAPRVVTCDPDRATEADPLGTLQDGAVLVDGDRLVAVGSRQEILNQAAGAPVRFDAGFGVMTPGLVDAHTHLAWAGSRHDEYVLRMAGAGYEELAAAGGGIVSSMRAVREASESEIASLMVRRLHRMAALGTTTCEIKSGYGLARQHELKQLRAIASVAGNTFQRIVPTFLPLHALPPEAKPRRNEWVHEVVEDWLPEVVKQKLARFVDAYIDRNAFQVEEAGLLFRAAVQHGLGIRAHVGQFADIGGAELAADVRASSVDHLENVSVRALERLATIGTRAVLLPCASFTLRQAPPPVQAIREAGVPIVIASDANPGSAPTESLPLALALALHTYGLTPEECLLSATREAAISLGLGDKCGQLAAGFSADVVLWDLPHERAIMQPWASANTACVVARGHVLHEASP